MNWVIEEGYTLQQGLDAVGPGWGELVRVMFAGKSPDCKVVQVKQKWAVLTIYLSHATDEDRLLADTLAEQSKTICEWCGAPGTVKGGRFVVLCDTCREMRDETAPTQG